MSNIAKHKPSKRRDPELTESMSADRVQNCSKKHQQPFCNTAAVQFLPIPLTAAKSSTPDLVFAHIIIPIYTKRWNPMQSSQIWFSSNFTLNWFLRLLFIFEIGYDLFTDIQTYSNLSGFVIVFFFCFYLSSNLNATKSLFIYFIFEEKYQIWQ